MSHVDRLAYMTAAALVSPLAVPAPTYAQDEPAVKYRLQEFIVTSRFREESVQYIGANVSALVGEDLVKQGVTTIDELARAMVGLSQDALPGDGYRVSWP